MDYRDALGFLDRHINLEARAGRIEGLSLDTMRKLLDVLGNPERAYRSVHITGTNGKGSVARLTSSLLIESGLTVGTYASPHLQRINERLQWNLEPISDEAFGSVIGEVAALSPLAGVEASYFELLTAAALTWFAEIAVDVAVVEVGLLGLFDATNVVDGDVAIVTNVGQDHTDLIGDWRTKVAEEKAGIIKPSSYAVIGEEDPDLVELFRRRPSLGSSAMGVDFEVRDARPAVGGQVLDLVTPAGAYEEVFLPLYGAHQADNALVALVAAEAFFGRELPDDVVEAAFGSLLVPGRFELVRRAPVVIIDGAHNPPGAAAAAMTLDEQFDLGGRRILVLALLQDRDPAQMLDAFGAATADLVVATEVDSARAMPAAAIAAAARALGIEVETVAGVADAIERAVTVAGDEGVVLIAGSLYLAGEAREILVGSVPVAPDPST